MPANYDKLAFGRTLSEWDGDKNNHGDCFNYGSIGGCDEDCPALCEGKLVTQPTTDRRKYVYHYTKTH